MSMKWIRTPHKTRRYDLYMSSCYQYFKKSTNKLHQPLEDEFKSLQVVKQLNLSKVQKLIDGYIDYDGVSYIITEYCGVNLRRSIVPPDWRDQLEMIDQSLNELKNVKIFHNDVQVRNIFCKDNNLCLIDFDLSTHGAPSRRSKTRPEFNCCDRVRDKITNRWKIK